MSLDNDTKTSVRDLAARVADNDLDVVVLLGGKIVTDENGDQTGMEAANIAEGDAVAMSNLLARFLAPFAAKHTNGAVLIIASMMQQLIEKRYGTEVDQNEIADQLVQMVKGMQPALNS